MTFGTKNAWNGSHVTTIIMKFDFYHNTLLSLAPIWSFGFLFDLCTWPFTIYATKLARHLYTSWKDILLWYYLQIVHLSRYEIGSSLDVI